MRANMPSGAPGIAEGRACLLEAHDAGEKRAQATYPFSSVSERVQPPTRLLRHLEGAPSRVRRRSPG